MSNKILTFVFVVLFVVLLGEVGYLYSTSQQKSVPSKNQVDLNKITENSVPIFDEGEKQAIGNDVFSYLSKSRLGILKTSILKNHFEGNLIELSNAINNPTIDYGIKIRFQGENGDVNGFFYNKDEATQRLSVFRKKKDSSLEKITLSDLKVGDSIWVDEELNLLDNDLNSFLISVRITIIE